MPLLSDGDIQNLQLNQVINHPNLEQVRQAWDYNSNILLTFVRYSVEVVDASVPGKFELKVLARTSSIQMHHLTELHLKLAGHYIDFTYIGKSSDGHKYRIVVEGKTNKAIYQRVP